jgi:3'-5' exoribonuclease
MEQITIRELKPGDEVLHYFIIRKKEIKEKRSNEYYLAFEFGDRSGRINGTLWDDVKEANAFIKVHDIVKIKGNVITYRENPHITIEKIRNITPADNISPDDFIPKTTKNTDELFQKIINIIDSIQIQPVRNMFRLILDDDNFIQGFKNSPAGKLWHHNYMGGLLEHTLSVSEICISLSNQYPIVNRDILITGAVLHDIGKISELTTDGFVDYSTEGRLLGHMAIAFEYIAEKISHIQDFPDELRNRILHCILSHHGQKEKGSPVAPMTMEAFLLHYADEIDSTINSFMRIEKKEKEPDKKWSNYVNLLDRFLYFGEE